MSFIHTPTSYYMKEVIYLLYSTQRDAYRAARITLIYDTRHRIAQQGIEAVIFIHKKSVIHSDLSGRQFLVDKRCNARLSDFGGSSLQGSDAIARENAIHFLRRDKDAPNTVQSDIFAIGSTIYEILVGHRPYEGLGDKEIQLLY
ncbi:kinase-like domain-containing protein [Aspergillus flavus]|uniref:Kinase-like domain-containing protein n=1 Tax=Aspergillus flavus (strain ATCC 200026 / FGSC A1120 / IAM 13836 / NRRL 3357 / JCM 12722 / SRRC 167) TaxID=332952 RepID=A0A7U2R0A1_ASPFN|nr:kinase-like domain-containing protein [Aspergillus flavus]